MEDKKSILVYIHSVGQNFKHENVYQFIFSSKVIDFEGYGWHTIPASDYASQPEDDDIDFVYEFSSKTILLDVLHDSENFAYIDAYDKVIALGWENIDESGVTYDGEFQSYVSDLDRPRLVFNYGMNHEQVEDILYSREVRFKRI